MADKPLSYTAPSCQEELMAGDQCDMCEGSGTRALNVAEKDAKPVTIETLRMRSE